MLFDSYIYKKFKNFTLLLLFVLVFSFPRELQNLKIAILAILLISNFTSKVNFETTRRKAFLFLFYTFIILSVVIIGILLNNETKFLFNSLKIVYFFPVLLIFVFSQFELTEIVDLIIKSSFFSLFLSFLINLSTLLFFLNLFPYNLNTFFYTQEDQIGFNQGYVHIINSSFSYWIFTIPLYFQSQILKSEKKHYFFLLLLFFLSIISGRRMLMLPFIIFLISSKQSRKILVIFILIACTLLLNDFVLQFLDFEVILNRFYDAINSSGDSEIRMIQSKRFLQYIAINPFFGFGMGSYMPDFIRSMDFRTAYESSYHYLFFERGVPLGICTLGFYGYLLLGVYKNSELKFQFRKGFVLAIISLLLASYSNPYWLSSFDYCIPFALSFRLFPNKVLI
jgi:hypothetical protein